MNQRGIVPSAIACDCVYRVSIDGIGQLGFLLGHIHRGVGRGIDDDLWFEAGEAFGNGLLLDKIQCLAVPKHRARVLAR